MRSAASRIISPLILAMFICAVVPSVWGAEQQAVAPLTQGDRSAAIPGTGRVAVVFLLTAGLAVGAIFALRRALPKFGNKLGVSGSLRVIDRISLSASVRVHLVQAETQKIVVVEGRGGLAVAVLPEDGSVPKVSQS
jgi:hypothetical protein